MNTAKFKDSPLGPIPQDWEVKRLGNLFDFAAAGDLQDNYSSKMPTHDNIYPIYSNTVPQKGLYGYTSRPRFKKGCMTITGRGTLGHAEYRDSDFDAIIRLIVMQPHKDVDARFFVAYVNTYSPFPISVSSIPQLTVPQVQETIVPCPPLPEQQLIAEALGEVDKLIESLDEQIEKKRLIAKGVAHDLLGMRNDKNEPIRRLPGFKGAWEKKDYKDVFLHHKGKSIGTSEYESSGQFPVIDQGQEAVVAYSNNTDALFHVPDGGAIVFGDHTRIVKYVSKDFIVGADGTQILSGLGCDTQFLYHALRQIEIPNLGYNRHFKFIKNHQYSLPPTLAEQQAIVDMLSEQDAAIAALEAKREKYVRIKEGMMRDLLTGKVRMKGE